MIQVYKQTPDIISAALAKYSEGESTYKGLTYKKELKNEVLSITVKGTCTLDADTYANIPVTKIMQKLEIGDYLRMETDVESQRSGVSFGIRYTEKSGGKTWLDLFTDGKKEKQFTIQEGAANIYPVFAVRGGNTVNAAFTVKVSYVTSPARNPEDFEARNGNATLLPTSASVHAILNGAWEASLEHPIDEDGRWKYLEEDNVVKMPSFNGNQLFRIKTVEKKDSGVSCDMEPIFYDAMGDCWLTDIRPTRQNGQAALDLMLAPNSRYSGSSDITRTATAYYQFKNFLEALNGDDENSFINRWGGEILFDNFEVIVNERVGGDYGVELRYGKNIPQDGLSEETDIRDVVTRIYPKAYNGYTMTNNGHVDSPLINNYPTVRTATITFSDVKMTEDAQEDDADNGVIICNTQAELDTALRKRCQEQYDAGLDKPKVTIEADMILLQNTELYKDYKILEDVGFGDTIHCRHRRLGITTDARVIELTYDSIRKRVESVVLGDFRYNYFQNVSSVVNRIDGAIRPDGSLVAEKITGFINGAMASLRAQYNVAKKQDVMAILFENLDKSSPLYGAMAMGTQGLMISNKRTADNKAWDWTTALTANGLIAEIIVAGIISDQTGKNWWDLDKGIIHIEEGYFSGNLEAAGGTFSGNLEAAGGTFSGNLTAAVGGIIGGWTINERGFTHNNMHIYNTGSIDDEEVYDGTTQIFPDGIMAQQFHGTIYASGGWSGTISIVTNVEQTSSGGFRVYRSNIAVEHGIITNAPG